ncbi:enkurin-like [Pseudonaja textilis]|uniref:enkurin-like n=1 Tax=Pseudonaja textilis TaxID=8673 RepID=UPI000EA8E9B9|nr:enkurin-like [Pseudonaja textilis]
MADVLCPPPPPEEQESIYHWLPTRVEGRARPQLRYISTFHPSVQREIEEKKKAPCQTMGIPKLQVPTPKDYLRKHSKERKVPKCTYERPKRLPVKAQVPPLSDRPLMGIQSEKNFGHANVAEAIMAMVKKPLHACVDQRRGDKYLLDGSSLVQKYLKKKDFGVTPNYILGCKKEAAEERQEQVAARRECLQKRHLTRLSSHE